MNDIVAIDFETYYNSKVGYTLRRMTQQEYCRHELFDPYLLAVYDGVESWVGHPREFNWAALKGKHLLAHNRAFDEEVVIELEKRGWIPVVGYRKFTCTSQMAKYVWGVDSLADAVWNGYGEKLDKQVRADADGRHFEDYNEKDRDDMLKYADGDSINCWRLFNDFGHLWPDWEQQLADITIRQGRHGIRIDRAELERQENIAYDSIKATEKMLPWRTNDWYDEDTADDDFLGPTSINAVRAECARIDVPPPPAKTTNLEAYEKWVADYGDKCPWLGALASWRILNKHRKLLQRVRERTDDQDIMYFILRYYQAHTGRWTGGGRMNMQNQRRDAILVDRNGIALSDKPEIMKANGYLAMNDKYPDYIEHALDFRRLLIARPGKKMIASDLAQIEPRCLAWLVGDWDLLEFVKTGRSIYEAHAKSSMGWDGKGKLKADNLQMYQLAKARVLSLGYGAGWKKFITMAQLYTGEDITADDPEVEIVVDPITCEEYEQDGYGKRSREIVNDFRATNPKITGLWNAMDDQLRNSVGGDLTLNLPSGRKMVYRKVAMTCVVRPDPEGKPKKKMVITAEVHGKRREFYGGKIVENLVQGVARDVFGQSVCKIDDAGIWNLFSAHDEAVTETDPDVTAQDVQELMAVTPEWLEGCPIDAEAAELTHYKK